MVADSTLMKHSEWGHCSRINTFSRLNGVIAHGLTPFRDC
jgi:hypothetical protein